ncbi:DUF2911 domain-containing protein [Niabella drilacis]|uniref:Uncharacterized protein n=1 Tax=Niabella drilacis (strain DSM 25811 / CCM 8410 / CCUG 62505 / LMG 26954 / E90) TaxID=1285928 RepID=A0A1G6I0C1_NIADE|nr:DUF2911 domain-containing protein [Niabella drilacis]SDB99833.1 Protein of unknown function [Niabella drilacis]
MKRILFSFLLAGVLSASQAQVKIPAASPAQTIKQDFGLGTLEWSYSRPSLKGRRLYADLAPAGKLWRTGANGATTLTVSDEIIVGGKTIPAGKYGLLTIPGQKSWTVILTQQTDVTSDPTAYKEADDVVRIQVTPVTTKTNTETFTIQLANVTPTTADLQLSWGNILVPVPIKTELDARIMASIDASMQSDKPAYFQAATYYLENNKDLNKAIGWFAKAAEAQPKAYWIQYQYAKALAKTGRKKEARAAAEASMQLAKENHNDDYVRNNQKLIATL